LTIAAVIVAIAERPFACPDGPPRWIETQRQPSAFSYR
jgi:hypothetical protein